MLYDIKKFNKRKSFNEGFWDDFTNRDVMQDYHVKRPSSAPAVNILRDEEEYRIELIAPGLCRDNYNIDVKDDILTVRAEHPARKDDDNFYERREYYGQDFERAFALPEHVRQEAISASCTDGILTIHIPLSKENKENKKRTIDIN